MDENIEIDRGCCSSNGGSCCKLQVYDWLDEVLQGTQAKDIVEVRFKNTRKDYYININGLKLKKGDIVAVEATPGHDIGVVSLTGDLVGLQLSKHKATLINGEMRKIYRIARAIDLEKWKEAISMEYETMIKSRMIASDLKLDMKIGDVEYQGDRTKAIFYYIADGRVDFRQLIRILAETFRIRIEMKQIGARQEAGRIGGLGPCGRELCCSTWITNFVSVTTNAARYQEISLNPQKLAGQCGKLKCCLNFEVDAYIDAQRNFPSSSIRLETKNGCYKFIKSDTFKGLMYYADDSDKMGSSVPLLLERVKKIIALNKKGIKPETLFDPVKTEEKSKMREFKDVLSQGDVTRFDNPDKKNSDKNRKSKKKNSSRTRGNKNFNKNRTPASKPEDQKKNTADRKQTTDNKQQRPDDRRSKNNRSRRLKTISQNTTKDEKNNLK